MPAKKAPAKKKTVRRAAPTKSAKKAPIKKQPVKRAQSSRKSAVNKAAKNRNDIEGLWDDELVDQYPPFKKNNFLSLIVLGLGALLVIVGIYIQVNKDAPVAKPANTQSGTTNTSPATGNGTAVNTGTQQAPVKSGATGTFPVDAQAMVEEFYTYFNQDQFSQMPAMEDSNFSTVAGLVTYFSPSRLQKWKANIIGDLQIFDVNAVIDNVFVQKNPNAMAVQYKTQYTLKQDGKTYTETWLAYILNEGGTYKINGFVCQENCAASPFFHLK